MYFICAIKIDTFIFFLKNSQTSVEQVRVEDCILEEEKLIKQQEELRGEVVDLTRLAQIKADEREQKSRDYMRAEVSINKLTNYYGYKVRFIYSI